MEKLKTRKELNIEKTYLEERREEYLDLFEKVRLDSKTMLSFCVLLLASYALAFGQELVADGMNLFSISNGIILGVVLGLNVICMFAMKHAVTNTSKKIFSISLMLSVGWFLIWFNLADLRYILYSMQGKLRFLDMFLYDFFYGVSQFLPLIIVLISKVVTFVWFIVTLVKVKNEIKGYVYNKKIPKWLIISGVIIFVPIMSLAGRRTVANSVPQELLLVFFPIAILLMTIVLMKFSINTIIYFQLTMFGKKEDEKME